MSSLAIELARLLGGIQRPGDYCTAGTCEIFAPGLEVEGVGPIALPLLPAQAEQLVAAAEQRPSAAASRPWSISMCGGPGRSIKTRSRSEAGIGRGTLAGIAGRAADGLGVTGPVTADLYKLLIYDEGSFFASHRDTEKAPGMFATLVIALPSISTGGALVVRHQDREARLDLRCHDPSEVAFAAFYADCQHEVLPVTSGCRLTLIYNLLRGEPGDLPRPPSYDAERGRLAELLRRWAEDGSPADGISPEKLIYPLEHAYTPAGLAFGALKGADAARAATLLAAAQAADCDLHLALLSIDESGSAEHTGFYGSYRRRGRHDESDDEEFEVSEVYDRNETLSEWRRPGGGTSELGMLPLEPEEVSPPDALDDMAPHDQTFFEATGNEGATFERSYRKAALVLWPSRRRLAVVNQAGLSATLPYLADLAERWVAGGEDRQSPLWAQANELSGHMLASWPMECSLPGKTKSVAATMLTVLSRLGDVTRIDQFLADVSAAGVFGKGDVEGVLPAIRLLQRPRIVELLEQIVAANAVTALDGCSHLLALAAAAAASGQLDLKPADLLPAAAALVESLPGDPARAPRVEPWNRPPAMKPGVVVDVLTALDLIDPGLAGAVAETFLAWPKTYGQDAVLVPAVLRLGGSPAAARLRAACVGHLNARIAEPLAPPDDWARPSRVVCQCLHCGELSRFLADPAHETWSLKAPQADRSHVEDTIRNSGCDLDFTTLRRSSPHSLVCTKNQASYERRAVQRKKDLEDLAKIEGRLK